MERAIVKGNVTNQEYIRRTIVRETEKAYLKEHKKMKQELYRMYVELGKMALEIEDDNRFQKIMKHREELFKLIEML